jgi:HAD superfamily hydrolase (TIGR01509 family)
MRLKALIFDVDGTLADTEEAHRQAFNAAFAAHGLGWNWSKSTYAELLATTGGKERIRAHIGGLELSADRRRHLLARVAEIHQSKTEYYIHLLSDGHLPLRAGIARLMEEARRAHIRLAIASTTTPVNFDALISGTLGAHAIAWFETIAAGDDVAHKKPAPDIFELVLSRLGLSAADCVAIEDSAKGLASAKGAGLFTVVTPSTWTQSEDFSEADLVLPCLGSPNFPLQGRNAQIIGNSMLRITDLERMLARSEIQPTM